jgi:hypothetical protein
MLFGHVRIIWRIVCFAALCFPLLKTNAFSPLISHTPKRLLVQTSAENAEIRPITDANRSWNVQVNEFFKKPVPPAVL